MLALVKACILSAMVKQWPVTLTCTLQPAVYTLRSEATTFPNCQKSCKSFNCQGRLANKYPFLATGQQNSLFCFFTWNRKAFPVLFPYVPIPCAISLKMQKTKFGLYNFTLSSSRSWLHFVIIVLQASLYLDLLQVIKRTCIQKYKYYNRCLFW